MRRTSALSAAVLALGLRGTPAVSRPLPAGAEATPSAAELKRRLLLADRVRAPWSEVVLTIRVTTTRPGSPLSTGDFEVAVKGERTRVRFLAADSAGQFVLTDGDRVWLFLPKTRNPIEVPKRHRLSGGFSVSDVARVKFAEDYDALIEREDTFEGRLCDVIRLTAAKDRRPTYPVVRLWIDRKETLYRKAIFLLESGRTAKEVVFDSYGTFAGALTLAKMTIVDALRPGTTTVEYLKYEKRALPDAMFDLAKARD